MAKRAEVRSTNQANTSSDGTLEQMAKAVPYSNTSERDEKPNKNHAAPQQQPEKEKKPSKLRQLWVKSELDL